MPAVIPYVVGYIAEFLGGTFFAYAAAYVVVAVAVYALIPKAKQPGAMGEAGGRQQIVRSSIEPRRVIIGRVRVSGPLVYACTTGADNKFLHMIIALAGHQCSVIGDVYFNDVLVGTLDGSGNVITGQFAGFARIKKHLGGAGQTADADLIAEDPTRWTANHRGDGITYLYVRLQFSQQVFPTGIPNVSAIVDGKLVFDPRVSATNYNPNAALAIRDYLTASYGLRCTVAELDEPSFITAANICDEAVAMLPSGTELRYTCNGSYNLAMRRVEIMEGLLTACLGQLTYTQGKYTLIAAAYRAPVGALTESDLAGPIKVSPRIARNALYNAVRGTYVDPARGYQLVDFPAVITPAYETEDGGEQIFKDIDLPYTQSASTAQRIAKIWASRSRLSIVVQGQWKPKIFKYSALDNITLSIARMGWVNKVFTIVDKRMSPTGQIAMTLQEEDSNAYAWTTADQTTFPAVAATNFPNPFASSAPTALVLDSSEAQLIRAADGTVISRIKATWTAPADIFVKSGGYIEVQAKKSADTVWTDYPRVQGADTQQFIAGVDDAVLYDVRIRSINSLGITSAYVTVLNHSVIGRTTLPPTITGLSLEQAFVGKDVSIKWNPEPSSSSYKVEVFAGAVLKRTVTNVTATRFDYKFDQNKGDGGPFRDLTFKVYGSATTGISAAPASLTVNNPQVAAVTGIATIGGPTTGTITWTAPADTDLGGYQVWMSTVTAFTPGPANLVYDGLDNGYTRFNAAAGVPLFFRVAAYDVFDKVGLNVSSEITVTPTGLGGIVAVTSLPGTGTLGQVVYLTTDQKLYRWNGTAWITWTDGADLLIASVTAGKIFTVSLAAINANLGAIIAGSITLDASGFIRGGQTAYNTGVGFWEGFSGGAYKMSVGNSGGNGWTWDGVSLSVRGAINVGAMVGYAWPAPGTNGVHLSASGVLMGNANNGKYFQFDAASGQVLASGLNISGASTFAGAIQGASGTFSGTLTAAEVISTANLQTKAHMKTSSVAGTALSYTSEGGVVNIFAAGSILIAPGTQANPALTLLVNGSAARTKGIPPVSDVAQSMSFAFMFVWQPGLVSFPIQVTGISGSFMESCDIVVIEGKKSV